MRIFYFMICGIIVSSIIGCASPESTSMQRPDGLYKRCKEPRPQICTREYRPVCATRDTGIRCVTTPCDSQEFKTYGNGCTACADTNVSEYRSGAC